MIEYNNCCVACGEIIPEGRQVCPQCERKYGVSNDNILKEQNIFFAWLKQQF